MSERTVFPPAASESMSPLDVDAARALLSDHAEGALDSTMRRRVDAALVSHASLRRDYDALIVTLDALRSLPRLSPPPTFGADVRAALSSPAPTRRRLRPAELFVGLAAAASIAAFVVVLVLPNASMTGAQQTQAAGVGDDTVVSATLDAPGMLRSDVLALAGKCGMTLGAQGAFEGDAVATARFVLLLQEAAAEHGSVVVGVVPRAPRIRLTVH